MSGFNLARPGKLDVQRTPAAHGLGLNSYVNNVTLCKLGTCQLGSWEVENVGNNPAPGPEGEGCRRVGSSPVNPQNAALPNARARERVPGTKPSQWFRVVFCLALVKAGYFVLLCSALWLRPDFQEGTMSNINEGWFEAFGVSPPAAQLRQFTRQFVTWDAEHYLYLSEAGYGRAVPSRAFYPLWPKAIRWFSTVTGGSCLLAGLILGNVFSLGAWALFYGVAARRFGQRVAFWSLILLIAFPGSLFYQFVYSESLFLLLLMLIWAGLEHGRVSLVLGAALLLPLARGVGLFAALPLAWCCALRMRWPRLDGSAWFLQFRRLAVLGERGNDTPHRPLTPLGALVVSCAPVLGFGLYLVLMRMWTGNALAGIEAQKYWGVHSLSNLWNVPKFVEAYFSPTCWHGFTGSAVDRCAFALLVCIMPMVWRLGKDMVLWTFALGVLPAMSGELTSFIRFESVVFPLFLGIGAILSEFKRRWPAWALAAGFTAAHAVLAWRFVNFRWAG